MTDEEVAGFLGEQRIARVASVAPDGSPHVVPIGHVLLDDRVPPEMRETALTQLLAIVEERVVVVVTPDNVASWDHTKR